MDYIDEVVNCIGWNANSDFSRLYGIPIELEVLSVSDRKSLQKVQIDFHCSRQVASVKPLD